MARQEEEGMLAVERGGRLVGRAEQTLEGYGQRCLKEESRSFSEIATYMPRQGTGSRLYLLIS